MTNIMFIAFFIYCNSIMFSNIMKKKCVIYNPTLIKLMDKVGLIEILYPDLYRLKEIKQHSKYHYENAFDHTMTALSYSKKDTEL